ncbi:MAG: hypothetical protein WDW38_006641 [Sanguina aurantia]
MTDEGTLEITMDISEEDADILQEVIDHACLLLEAVGDGPPTVTIAVVTSYTEHDFPTLTTLHVEGVCVVIRTESQADSGATYRRRMSVPRVQQG